MNEVKTAPTAQEYQQIRLERTDDTPVKFCGVKVREAYERDEHSDSYASITLYQTEGGQFVAHTELDNGDGVDYFAEVRYSDSKEQLARWMCDSRLMDDRLYRLAVADAFEDEDLTAERLA